MRVDDVLRGKDAPVGTVRMDELVAVALRLLTAEDSGALVVTDPRRTEGGRLAGMLSEREVVRALADRGVGALTLPVSAVMRCRPVCCRRGDPVRRVLLMMEEHEVRHVPVLDGGMLVGVVGLHDLARLADAPTRGRAAELWDFPVAAHQ